jgi:hypothetical protein
MPDAVAIAGMIQSLNAVTQISKALLGIRDAALIREKIIELNGEVISAQAGALAAQTDQFALLERIRNLESQVAQLETWNAEAQTYQLKDVAKYGRTGQFAYAPKEGTHLSEPPHLLCAECYNNRHKSVLQQEETIDRREMLTCNHCKNILYLVGGHHK